MYTAHSFSYHCDVMEQGLLCLKYELQNIVFNTDTNLMQHCWLSFPLLCAGPTQLPWSYNFKIKVTSAEVVIEMSVQKVQMNWNL